MVTAMGNLTGDEVDGLPSHVHGHGPVRQEYLHNWGVRAGRESFRRGHKVNCFRRVAHMPMFDAWAQGYRLAQEEEWKTRVRVTA